MARKAPPISVKDLTAALAIGKQQGKEESLVAADPLPADDPFAPARPNPNAPPSSPWLPGKSPAPSRPSLAHGKHFDEYGQPIQDPGFGIDPGGNPIRLPHMEQTPEEKKRNKGLHDWKYHDGPDPDVVRGMMIMADAAGLTEHLKGIGQDQRTGTMRKSGLGPDELIKQLLIGVDKFKA